MIKSQYIEDHAGTLQAVTSSFSDAVRSKDLDLFNFLVLSVAAIAKAASEKLDHDLDVLAN